MISMQLLQDYVPENHFALTIVLYLLLSWGCVHRPHSHKLCYALRIDAHQNAYHRHDHEEGCFLVLHYLQFRLPPPYVCLLYKDKK
ncbi:Uncharacterised protein [Chlamydia abortus]|nr:Uncharacterised protein [Chlamydia abortus]